MINAIKLFFKFILESFYDFKNNYKSYANSFYALIVLGILNVLPLLIFESQNEGALSLIFKLVTTILLLIVIVNIIIIKKSFVNLRAKDSLIYSSCTYLIYTLYTSIIFLAAGFLLFISISFIPELHQAVKIGFGAVGAAIVIWLFALVPLTSVLIDNDQVNYFKLSIKLVRQNCWLVLIYGIFTLLQELTGYIFNYVTKNQMELAGELGNAIIGPFFTLLLTLTSVRIFYYLKELSGDTSQ